jgi:phosphohistidine phosphatase
MKLYLVQHGEAVAKEIDPERPLSAEGCRDVERLARFLAPKRLEVSRILHSGKPRARQTAEILGEALAPEISPEAVAGLEPNDSPASFIAGYRGTLDGLLIAGHLPFLARLVSYLVLGSEDRTVTAFQPGSLVCLEWQSEANWRIAWMLRPRLFGE